METVNHREVLYNYGEATGQILMLSESVIQSEGSYNKKMVLKKITRILKSEWSGLKISMHHLLAVGP